jgi:hypothetical protein
LTKSIIVLREMVSLESMSFFGRVALLKLVAIADFRLAFDLAGSKEV